MNELPIELVIEIFEKISLRDLKTFIKLSKINKQFNGVYKKYFEEKVKIYDEIWYIGKKVKVSVPRNGNLLYGMYLFDEQSGTINVSRLDTLF
jgi:hypothetical protein